MESSAEKLPKFINHCINYDIVTLQPFEIQMLEVIGRTTAFSCRIFAEDAGINTFLEEIKECWSELTLINGTGTANSYQLPFRTKNHLKHIGQYIEKKGMDFFSNLDSDGYEMKVVKKKKTGHINQSVRDSIINRSTIATPSNCSTIVTPPNPSNNNNSTGNATHNSTDPNNSTENQSLSSTQSLSTSTNTENSTHSNTQHSQMDQSTDNGESQDTAMPSQSQDTAISSQSQDTAMPSQSSQSQSTASNENGININSISETEIEEIRLQLLQKTRTCYLKHKLMQQTTSVTVNITVVGPDASKKFKATVSCPVEGCTMTLHPWIEVKNGFFKRVDSSTITRHIKSLH